jgi:hypothetical protein
MTVLLRKTLHFQRIPTIPLPRRGAAKRRGGRAPSKRHVHGIVQYIHAGTVIKHRFREFLPHTILRLRFWLYSLSAFSGANCIFCAEFTDFSDYSGGIFAIFPKIGFFLIAHIDKTTHFA